MLPQSRWTLGHRDSRVTFAHLPGIGETEGCRAVLEYQAGVASSKDRAACDGAMTARLRSAGCPKKKRSG